MALALYKFVGGEEVLAKEVKSDDTTIVIDDCVTLVYHQSEKGVSVGFAPFMPQSEGKITIFKNTISAIAEPNDQMVREHTRIFSGIVLA